MKLKRFLPCLLLLCSVATASPAPASAMEPTPGWNRADRLACGRLLADFEWARRTWPAENRSIRPARTSIVSDALLESRLDSQLRMQAALTDLYGIAPGAVELQAEMNRMVAQSRDPAALEAMYTALGRSPAAFAECVVRPELVERWLRHHFARDPEQHAAIRRAAEVWLAGERQVTALADSGGQHSVVRYLRAEPATERTDADAVPIGEAAWQHKRQAFALSRSADRTVRQPSVFETEVVFQHEELLAESANQLTVSVHRWPKRSFDDWWSAARTRWSPASPPGVAVTWPAGRGKVGGAVPANSWWVPDVPRAFDNHLALWNGTEMLVWEPAGLGFCYSPLSDRWRPMSAAGGPLAGTNAFTSNIYWTGSVALVWNSSSGSGARYQPDEDRWRPVAAVGAPGPGQSLVEVWTGSELMIWSGTISGQAAPVMRAYNPVTDVWRIVSQVDPPAPRGGEKAVWTGTEMLIWGGQVSEVSPLGAGAIFSPQSGHWRLISSEGAPSRRVLHSMLWTGSRVLVWGGMWENTWLRSGASYDPVLDTWAPISPVGAPQARRANTTLWTGAEMVLWGGSEEGTYAVRSGARYHPASDTWRDISLVGAPLARNSHTAIWTGADMIVWGGAASDGLRGDGGRYDPAQDSWRPVHDDIGLLRRMEPSATFTGTELIVWGGFNYDLPLPLGDGARFRLATASWRAISSAGAPSGRSRAQAVWTGTEMVLWGGRGPAYWNEVAHYNPTADAWTLVGSTGAPEGRDYYSTIWSGSELIVFGGYRDSMPVLNTGGRYNPSSRQWTPTATAGASPAALHSATWIGSEMVVWGGSPGIAARYRPASNSWVPMATALAPLYRGHHSAIWTGQLVIVWGGSIGGCCSGTESGAFYHPDSDSWFPISENFPDIPLARTRHAAVWTGTEMVVWGGMRYTPYGENDGEVFHPQSDTWRAISTANAPYGSNTRDHAFWTGNAMLLWGDYFDGAPRLYYPYGFVIDVIHADGFEAP